MFNPYDTIDSLIGEYNDDVDIARYESVYDELCQRVNAGELTVEEAELINDRAAEMYLEGDEMGTSEPGSDKESPCEGEHCSSNKEKNLPTKKKKKRSGKKLAFAAGVATGAIGSAMAQEIKRKKEYRKSSSRNSSGEKNYVDFD